MDTIKQGIISDHLQFLNNIISRAKTTPAIGVPNTALNPALTPINNNVLLSD